MNRNWKVTGKGKYERYGILLQNKSNETKVTLHQLKKQKMSCTPSTVDLTKYLEACGVRTSTMHLNSQSSKVHSFQVTHFFAHPHQQEMANLQSQTDDDKIEEMTKEVCFPIGSDGAEIICQEDGGQTIGLSEMVSSFMASPGVDPKLIIPSAELWIRYPPIIT